MELTPEQQQALQNARARRGGDTEALRQQAIANAKLRRSEAAKPMENTSIGRTALEQGLQGGTFGFSDEITDRIGALIASRVTGEDYDTLLNEARQSSQRRMAQQMEERPALSIASQLAGGILTGGAASGTKAGTAIASGIRSGGTGASLAKTAAASGATGALYGAGTAKEGERIEGAVTGGMVGAALPVAFAGGGAAVKAAGKAVTPTIQEGMLPVVELAKKYKIPVSLSQVAEGNAIKNIQKVSKELPLSGESAFKEKQLKSFNRALIRTTGGDASKFSPELMNRLFKEVGGEFDKLAKGKQFELGDDFVNAMDTIAQEAQATGATKEAMEAFTKNAMEIINNAENNVIKGETLSTLRSKINARARKAAPETAELLRDLENAIVDMLTSSDEAAAQAFSKTKQKYKNLLVIEPLAQKAKGGNISPTQLNNRVAKIYGRAFTTGKAGEIGDLARIGSEIMPELGGSDTVQKSIYAGGLGAALLNPVAAAANLGTAGTVLAGNRAFQELINRNPKVLERAIKSTAKQLKANPQALLP